MANDDSENSKKRSGKYFAVFFIQANGKPNEEECSYKKASHTIFHGYTGIFRIFFLTKIQSFFLKKTYANEIFELQIIVVLLNLSCRGKNIDKSFPKDKIPINAGISITQLKIETTRK